MKSWTITLKEPLSFAQGAQMQESLVAARSEDAIPDTVLFLQHTPVVTLGRRGRRNHLLTSPESLRQQGVDFEQASRGGDVTFHAPGQWVMYPILKLGTREADAHGYLHNLEEIAIRTAGDSGVRAFRVDGKNGAWTDRGKIAAIGFHLKRWVTLHGLSFNVNVDLAGFDLIVPCGLAGARVTSLKDILGPDCPPLDAVQAVMAGHFEQVLERELEPFPEEEWSRWVEQEGVRV